MENNSSIEKLIVKHLLGNITTSEKEKLNCWIKASPDNEKLFNRLCTSTSFRKRYEIYSQINSNDAWMRFKKRHYGPSFINISKFTKYAAILILPVLLAIGGWYIYSLSYPPFEESLSSNLESGDAIQPGISKAILTLAPNNNKSITGSNSASVFVGQTTKAIVQNGALTYLTPADDAMTDEDSYSKKVIENNILTTEQGNEFKVTFEDGTDVHLNYNTQIRYPVKFNKYSRVVFLQGEAYFKVAKDARPFYVITDNGTIKQYGTEFNVNTFTSKRTEVVLVIGSISITPKGSDKERFLQPGQLAYTKSDNDSVSVSNVDITPYVAWNEGRLIFENRPLANIVEVLERWYNVKVSFGSPKLKQLQFTGNMDRYATITPILKAIARTTNLHIHIEGRNILITEY